MSNVSMINTTDRINASKKARSPWGVRIEELLDGRSQAWLAQSANVSPSTLASIIASVEPKADNMVRIARALGTTAEYLMTGEKPPGVSGGKVSEPPTNWEPSDARVHEVGNRVAEARGIVEEATQIAGVIPTEALRQAMLTLQFRYGVESDDLALLLVAASRPQIGK